jgi:small subunit ribosomal protein S13
MLYLFETELLKNKTVILALKLIFGLGNFNATLAIKKLGFSKNLKIKSLLKKQIHKLIRAVNSLNILLANDLKKFRFSMFQKLLNIKSIKGFRKSCGLPIRGQRTHTNAKTARKVKKT